MKYTTVFLGCFYSIFVVFLICFLFSLVFMFLWNWIIPIFWVNAPILTLFESFGCVLILCIVCGIIKSIFNPEK